MAFIDIGWRQRGIRIVNAGRPSGEDKSLGVQRGYLFPGGIMRYQLAVYLALSYSSGDKQAVLRAEINDDYGFTFGTRHSLLYLQRLLATQLLGNLQIGGDLNIAAGGDAVAVVWCLFGFIFSHLYAKDYHCDILSSRQKIIPAQVIRTMWDKLPSDVQQQVKQGISVLEQGGVVAFPTDTVYGLGACASNEQAIERVYELKGRPRDMALPLLLAGTSQIGEVTENISQVAWLLIHRFLPGALTLVLPKSDALPDIITAGGETVAVRIPAHPVPLALAEGIGTPIVGTSANLSGKPSTLTADDVLSQFGDKIDLVIDGGRCPGGRESTIVDVTGETPVILREGAITRGELEQVYEGITLGEGD